MMVYNQTIQQDFVQTYLHLDMNVNSAVIRLDPQVDLLHSLILCDGRRISSSNIQIAQGNHLLAYELQDYSGRILESREIRIAIPASLSQTNLGISDDFLREQDKTDTDGEDSDPFEESNSDRKQDESEQIEQDKSEQSEQAEQEEIELAEPFHHSGAVILASKQLVLKFQEQPEKYVLWVEENGEKRKIELDEKEITISLKEDLARAYLEDEQGNVLKKWSILCLENEEDLHTDPALNLKDSSDEEDSSSSQNDSSSSQEIEPIPEPTLTTSTIDVVQNDTAADVDSKLSEDSPQTEIPVEQTEPSKPVEGTVPTETQEPIAGNEQPAPSRPDIWAPNQVTAADLDQIRNNTIPLIPQVRETPQIHLITNEKEIDAGKSLYTHNLADLEFTLTNGTMQSVEIHSLDTGQTYPSFKEASKSEQAGTFEVIAKYFDNSDQIQEASWTVVGIGDPVATSAATQGKKVDTVYQVDEQGKLNVQTQSQQQKMQLYRGFEPIEANTIRTGEELRLYLDKEPGSYEMEINGKKTEVEIRKDELGQPYLPVEPKKGTSTIQLFKDGQEVFSQDIVAQSQSHFWTWFVFVSVFTLIIGVGAVFFKRHHTVYA